jgi:hypothetical protein
MRHARHSNLPAVVCILFFLAINALAQRPMDDIGRYLHNTVRPDVWSMGLWMPMVEKKLTGWMEPAPGFVGDVYYVHTTSFKGLYSYKFIDEGDTQLIPKVVSHDWYPTHTVTKYRAGSIIFTETKSIPVIEQAISDIRITSTSTGPQRISVIVEDLLPGTNRLDTPFDNALVKSLNFSPTTYYFRDLKIGKHYSLRARLGSTWLKPEGGTTLKRDFVITPKSRGRRLTISLKLATDREKILRALRSLDEFKILPGGENAAIARYRREFNERFKQLVPAFRSSDPYLEKMYYYRWYLVLKTSICARCIVPDHPYPYPALYEGLLGTWFPKVIGLPIPLQIIEARWLNDKSIAYNHARVALTKEDFFNYLNWTPYAFWQLHLVAPDQSFLKEALPKVKNFIRLEEVKDEDGDWLPSVFGSWITGMEYQPSFFQFTSPRWDHKTSEEFKPDLDALSRDPKVYHQFTPIERVDEATYYYLNNIAAQRISELSGEADSAAAYALRARQIKSAVDQKMWDDRTGFFYDLKPETDEKALEAKEIVGFWPYLFGEMQSGDKLSLFDHMINKSEFWTKYPIATASQDCPAFDPHGYWKVGPNASKEKPFFYEDSWNGPTWMFSQSLAAETLGQAARMSRSPLLKSRFNELMKTYTRLQFVNGDLSLPCTVEHYDSDTGKPIRFLADYFHSFYNDLVIRYLAGITPRQDDLIEIDPLLEGMDHFEINDVRYRGHQISVSFNRSTGFTVKIDSLPIIKSRKIQRVLYNPDEKRLVRQ